jgi:hypothetical protein
LETRKKRLDIQSNRNSIKNNNKKIEDLLYVEEQTVDYIKEYIFNNIDEFNALDDDIYEDLEELKNELNNIIEKIN